MAALIGATRRSSPRARGFGVVPAERLFHRRNLFRDRQLAGVRAKEDNGDERDQLEGRDEQPRHDVGVRHVRDESGERRPSDRSERAGCDEHADDSSTPGARVHIRHRDSAEETGPEARTERDGRREQSPGRICPYRGGCEEPRDDVGQVPGHETGSPPGTIHPPPDEQGAAGGREVEERDQDPSPAFCAGEIDDGHDRKRHEDARCGHERRLSHHQADGIAMNELVAGAFHVSRRSRARPCRAGSRSRGGDVRLRRLPAKRCGRRLGEAHAR